MSCINGNAPIDISQQNVIGNCKLKCDYQYEYVESNSTITNKGDYLLLSYSSQSSIKYNSQSYLVNEIRLYQPSLHSYSHVKADAEIIVVHTSANSPEMLLVCIPIKNTTAESAASQMLDKIISAASSLTPSKGETTDLSSSGFNLNDFIPKIGFFSYTGTLLYQPCTLKADYIVYNNLFSSYIDISLDSITKLQNIISSNTYDVKSSNGAELFYNKHGATSSTNMNDDIYIDCAPVGESEEKKTVVYSTSSPITFNSLMQNNIFMASFMCIIFIIVILCFSKILKFFSGLIKVFNYNNPHTKTVVEAVVASPSGVLIPSKIK